VHIRKYNTRIETWPEFCKPQCHVLKRLQPCLGSPQSFGGLTQHSSAHSDINDKICCDSGMLKRKRYLQLIPRQASLSENDLPLRGRRDVRIVGELFTHALCVQYTHIRFRNLFCARRRTGTPNKVLR
jgi:hypothetical protein